MRDEKDVIFSQVFWSSQRPSLLLDGCIREDLLKLLNIYLIPLSALIPGLSNTILVMTWLPRYTCGSDSYCHSNLVWKITLDSWLLAAFICSYCHPWPLAGDCLFGLCSAWRLRFSLWVQLDLHLAVGLTRSAPQNWFCLHWKSCAHGDGRTWNANSTLKHTAHVCCAPSVNIPQTKASHMTELNSNGTGPWPPLMKILNNNLYSLPTGMIFWSLRHEPSDSQILQ